MRFLIVLLLLAWSTAARAEGRAQSDETPTAELGGSGTPRLELGAGLALSVRTLAREDVLGGAIFGEAALPSTFGLRFFRPSARLGLQYLESRVGDEIYFDIIPREAKFAFLGLFELCPLGTRTTFDGAVNVGAAACVAGHVGAQNILDASPFWLDGGGLGRVYLEIGRRSQARFTAGLSMAALWRIVGEAGYSWRQNRVLPQPGIEASVLFP